LKRLHDKGDVSEAVVVALPRQKLEVLSMKRGEGVTWSEAGECSGELFFTEIGIEAFGVIAAAGRETRVLGGVSLSGHGRPELSVVLPSHRNAGGSTLTQERTAVSHTLRFSAESGSPSHSATSGSGSRGSSPATSSIDTTDNNRPGRRERVDTSPMESSASRCALHAESKLPSLDHDEVCEMAVLHVARAGSHLTLLSCTNIAKDENEMNRSYNP